MRTGLGIAVMSVSAAAGLVVAARWRRLPERVATALVAVVGATLGAGALFLQDDPGAVDWVATLGVLALLTPLHCRMALGRPGRAP